MQYASLPEIAARQSCTRQQPCCKCRAQALQQHTTTAAESSIMPAQWLGRYVMLAAQAFNQTAHKQTLDRHASNCGHTHSEGATRITPMQKATAACLHVDGATAIAPYLPGWRSSTIVHKDSGLVSAQDPANQP
jgi:hypothetical protein